MTPRRALTLMLQRQEKLTEAQRSDLEEVCQLHPQIRLAYSLLEQFAQMLRNRRGEELDLWLQAAFHSGLPGMRAFVQKILQDQEAVQVGSFSNGTMGQWKARSTASNCSSEVCMDGLILTYCACESSIIESGHEPNSWIQYRLKDQTPLQLQSEALWLDASQLDCAFLTRQS